MIRGCFLRIHGIGLIAVAIIALATTRADASFISNSPDPMVGGNIVTTGAFQSPFGYVTNVVTNISETSNTITAGNDVIDYTATSNLTFYSDPSLTTVLGTASLTGSFEIEIFGRTSAFSTGHYNFDFTSSTVSGMVDGASVVVQLNPSMTSGGSTTITAGPGVGQFTIDTTATQYSQYTINGGSPINTPAPPTRGRLRGA